MGCYPTAHTQLPATMRSLLTPSTALHDLFSPPPSISPLLAHVLGPRFQPLQPSRLSSPIRCSGESLHCRSPILDPDCLPAAVRRSDDIPSQLVLSADPLQPFSAFPDVPDNEFYSAWIASRFAAPVQSSPAPKQKQESSERDNFYANMGSAVRILREEMPAVFYKDLNYDIYRNDIVFRDPRNTFTGIDNYKLIFWALRFHGRIFFKAIWVDVCRIWQPSDRVIIVRWTVRGIPRVPWEAHGIFEGTSEYKLDKEGKVYEHKVDNVALNYPPMLKTRTVVDLLATASCAAATPTFFDRVLLACWIIFPYLKISSWERFYWALIATLDIQNNTQWWSRYAALQ